MCGHRVTTKSCFFHDESELQKIKSVSIPPCLKTNIDNSNRKLYYIYRKGGLAFYGLPRQVSAKRCVIALKIFISLYLV